MSVGIICILSTNGFELDFIEISEIHIIPMGAHNYIGNSVQKICNKMKKKKHCFSEEMYGQIQGLLIFMTGWSTSSFGAL